MLKNYIKIAWRNLIRNKVYSAINIVGLAAGMAVAMLIGLWIWDELTFNYSFANHKRIARVMLLQAADGREYVGGTVSMPIGYALEADHTGPGADFKYTSLVTWNMQMTLGAGEKKLSRHGMGAQPDFPEMLTLNMIQGRRDGLKDPHGILLNRSVVKALFGHADPMGKTVKLNNATDLKVTGVYEDLPVNTNFNGTTFLFPWEVNLGSGSWIMEAKTQWNNHLCQLFVQLNDGVDIARASERIRKIPTPHVERYREEVLLHAMDDWHLYTDEAKAKIGQGDIQFVWLFGIIGVFVLLLACINFMNLATARSEKRAKEVGIRKSIGSMRGQLIGQFLSESLVMTAIALVLALAFVQLALPAFNTLASKAIQFPYTNSVFWAMVFGFTLFTGLISGTYPAFYLSGFRPVQVLKGTFRVGRFAALPRKVLVVIQFTVSVSLIIGTIIVFRQIQHAKDRPVGYNRDGLIRIEITTGDLQSRNDLLKRNLLNSGGAIATAKSNSVPTNIGSNNNDLDWRGKDPGTILSFGTISVSHDYGKTLGWQIVDGRDFSRDYPTDTGALILNEAAVKQMGLKNPVGQMVKWNDGEHPIVGVVKDMVMDSPYQPATPTVFHCDPDWANQVLVRLKPGMPVRAALALIEPIFLKHNPSCPFTYNFVDEEYGQKFASEERIGNLATVFAGLAIFISCLGLFGLASFVAEQRTKEIGVRKVLGATVFNLWTMLSKDFVLLVIISCGIAVPIARYFLKGWLENYDYRAPMSWWIFAGAVLGALAVTLLTVSFQAIKAALANPVRSLRTE